MLEFWIHFHLIKFRLEEFTGTAIGGEEFYNDQFVGVGFEEGTLERDRRKVRDEGEFGNKTRCILKRRTSVKTYVYCSSVSISYTPCPDCGGESSAVVVSASVLLILEINHLCNSTFSPRRL
jgi:hypothetical protein